MQVKNRYVGFLFRQEASMTLKLCKSCLTMKNIRGKKLICKRCEEGNGLKDICFNCNSIIKGNLRLMCSCNHTFCSQECLSDFHDKRDTMEEEDE